MRIIDFIKLTTIQIPPYLIQNGTFSNFFSSILFDLTLPSEPT
jgi:hypothetical protein